MRPPLRSPEQAVLALSLGWCPAAYPLDRHHHDRFPEDREEVGGLPLVAAWNTPRLSGYSVSVLLKSGSESRRAQADDCSSGVRAGKYT